jgi:hypothetical protein
MDNQLPFSRRLRKSVLARTKVRGEGESEEIMGNQHSSSSSFGMTGKLVLAATTGIGAALLAWNCDFFQRSGNTLSLFAFN